MHVSSYIAIFSAHTGGLFVGFAAFQFLFYSLAPHLLKLTSAVVFNLSLLTADIYTLLFGLFLFHYKVGNQSMWPLWVTEGVYDTLIII